MSKFSDMLDWQLEEHSVMPASTIERPYNDFLAHFYNECNSNLECVRMSQSTHDAICEQVNIKPILTMNGLTVIISESLPDNVYKFD